MSILKYKGKRIRASDKSLVYRFCGGSLLFLFVAVILLLNLGQIMRTDWDTFSLIRNDGLALSLSPLQLHNNYYSDWYLYTGRFSVLPLLL